MTTESIDKKPSFFSLLSVYISNKDFEKAKKLIEINPNINLNDVRDTDDKNIVLAYLPDLEPQDHLSNSPLREFIRYLQSKGLDINAKNKKGQTPTEYLLWDENRFDHVKFLIAQGSAVKFSDDSNLFHSVDDEVNQECIDYFKSIGLDINQKTTEGVTPLHASLNNTFFNAAMLLVDNGANLDLKDDEGNNIFHFFKDGLCYESTDDFIKSLERKGFDVKGKINEKNYNGFTPLHEAVLNGDFGTACLLAEYGADPTLLDSEGNNLLHLIAGQSPSENSGFAKLFSHGWNCCTDQSWEAFIKLLKSKFNVENMLNEKNHKGVTPLEIIRANQSWNQYYFDAPVSNPDDFITEASETHVTLQARIVTPVSLEKLLTTPLFQLTTISEQNNNYWKNSGQSSPTFYASNSQSSTDQQNSAASVASTTNYRFGSTVAN